MVKDFLTMGWYNLSQFWEKRQTVPFVRIFAELNRGIPTKVGLRGNVR